ncbi:MAG TPA: DoxX family protein [Candidatus Baltobacteraceae bacterium]
MKARVISGWVLSGIAALLFFTAGCFKLSNNPIDVNAFTLYGLSLPFMYAVGVAEIAGAATLLTKQRLAGAVVLTIVGLGAAFEHLTHAQAAFAPIPLVLAAFALGGALLRGAA